MPLIGTLKRSLSLAAALVSVSLPAEVTLDFNLNGPDPETGELVFSNLAGTTTVNGGALSGGFSVVSNPIVGATGDLAVRWSARGSSGGAEDAAVWSFGDATSFHSANVGLGVASPGEGGGELQFNDGEAILLSFDLSNLTLSPGASLVFRLRSGSDESFRVFQRTGAASGASVLEYPSSNPATFSSDITVSGYEPLPDVIEFVIVDAGWNGGGRNRILGFEIDVLNGTPLPADPILFPVFTDNMVLQRDVPVAIYGTGEPGDTLSVSFGAQDKAVEVGPDGNWLVRLDAMSASSIPQTLTVSNQYTTRTISNVLVGDVWLASGQSNMDRPFANYAALDPSGRDNPNIRLMIVSKNGAAAPAPTFEIDGSSGGSWQECEEFYLNQFSTTGYFFAAELESKLGIPIGVIEAAVGGTSAETWTPRTTLADLGYAEDSNHSRNFNGLIHPLRDFDFKGVIWYQGESNARRALEHEALFKALITSWRDLFGAPEMPFYFAQISSLATRGWDSTGEAWAWLRETQTAALSLPFTGMAVTIDVGEHGDIHPQNKAPVGERLARHALKAEGVSIIADSPRYQEMSIEGRRAILNFSNPGTGLETREVRMNRNVNLAPGTDPEAFVVPAATLSGFEICGPSRIFVEAEAVISGSNQVTVSSPLVPNPVAVRYAWKWFPLANLYSSAGLPAVPFRSDSFAMPLPGGEFTGAYLEGEASDLGEAMLASTTGGDSVITPVSVDGIDGFSVTRNGGTRSQYFTAPEAAFRSGQMPEQVIHVLYQDVGQGQIEVQYDGVGNTGAVVPDRIELTNDARWRVATFVLDDAYFGGRLSGFDLRVSSDSADMVIGGVYIDSFPGGTAYRDWGGQYAFFGDHESDPDGDRQTHFDEFRAGNHPLDPRSALRVEKFESDGPGSFGIDWTSVAGRSYRILSTSDSLSGPWEILREGISATEPLNRETIAPPASVRFFLIEVE